MKLFLSQITQLKLRKRLKICNSDILCHSERSEELSEAFSRSEASNLWLCKLPGYTDVSQSLH
jgi:hypothetical protein